MTTTAVTDARRVGSRREVLSRGGPESMQRDPLRSWVSSNLPAVAFLGAYFVTIVAGNLIFASPLGAQSLAASGLSDRFLGFPHTFTPGFWLLLLCPFVLTPLVVVATRRVCERAVHTVATALPEFSRAGYATLTVACFGFVAYRFWLADVATLFASGLDAASSVEARFAIRARIGYVTLAPLQAILPFLSIYALVRSIQSREAFWLVATGATTLMVSILLIMINMKWPVLLFYVGLVLTIFVYARSRPYLKTAAGALFVFVAFLVVSSFVFRLAPSTPPDQFTPGAHRAEASVPPVAPAGSPASPSAAAPPTATSPAPTLASPPAPSPLADTTSALTAASERFVATTRVAPGHTPTLLVLALNRMAISYPYYYQVFTEEGAVCGGILAQARRDPRCRPSEVIYNRIFVNDEFKDRGTSPLGVHISGYALGGWPIALLALTAASVILGLFAALPLDRGPMTGALTILGGLTGYHLSQIPGEGVIFYEHGLIWPSLLILGYGLISRRGRDDARPVSTRA